MLRICSGTLDIVYSCSQASRVGEGDDPFSTHAFVSLVIYNQFQTVLCLCESYYKTPVFGHYFLDFRIDIAFIQVLGIFFFSDNKDSC